MTDPATRTDGPDVEGLDPAETEKGAAERLSFFSDAVVAIAITLLAIELEVPRGDTFAELAHGFAENWGEYLAFLISFAVIARHWISHHRLFRYVGRATMSVVWLNMLWLLMIVITPFLTRLISEDHVDFPRFTFYAMGQLIQVVAFAALIRQLGRTGGFLPGTPAPLVRRGWIPSLGIAVGFLISIPLFLLVGPWAFACWAVIPWISDKLTDHFGWTRNMTDL
ncbi:TMEM175 family protein [Pseudonocardia ailaonensis]